MRSPACGRSESARSRMPPPARRGSRPSARPDPAATPTSSPAARGTSRGRRRRAPPRPPRPGCGSRRPGRRRSGRSRSCCGSAAPGFGRRCAARSPGPRPRERLPRASDPPWFRARSLVDQPLGDDRLEVEALGDGQGCGRLPRSPGSVSAEAHAGPREVRERGGQRPAGSSSSSAAGHDRPRASPSPGSQLAGVDQDASRGARWPQRSRPGRRLARYASIAASPDTGASVARRRRRRLGRHGRASGARSPGSVVTTSAWRGTRSPARGSPGPAPGRRRRAAPAAPALRAPRPRGPRGRPGGRRDSARRARRPAPRYRSARTSGPRRGVALAIAPCERAVRDLPDERLDERVLAALGGARVRLEEEKLAPDQAAQPRLQASPAPAASRRRAPRR